MRTGRIWMIASMLAAAASAQQPTPPTRPPPQPQPQSPPRTLFPMAPQAAPRPQPAEPPSPLASTTDARAAIEAAKHRAAARGTRVLVIWASGPGEELTRTFVIATRTSDVSRLLGMEFETVWADCSDANASGKPTRGAANRELARSLGVEVKPGAEHAMLSVLDASGKPLASISAEKMLDGERPRTYSVLKIQDFLGAQRAAPPVTKDTLAAAVARAKPAGRAVLVTFGEFGHEWSESFVRWLAQPEVAGALEPTVIVLPVELLRDTGALEVLSTLGGDKAQSLPWFVLVGADGKPIIASQTEKTPNIGFPTDDGEIDVFLAMLKKAAPTMKESDAAAIRASLVEHRTGKR